MSNLTIQQRPNAVNEILYPNAESSPTDMTCSTGSEHYSLVDEIWYTPNDSDYVYSNSNSVVSDLYECENSSVGAGTINYVTFKGRFALNSTLSDVGYVKFKWYDGSTVSNSPDLGIYEDGVFRSYEHTASYRPTGHLQTWTWADINNLEIGVKTLGTGTAAETTTTAFYPTGNGSVYSTSDFGRDPEGSWDYYEALTSYNGSAVGTDTTKQLFMSYGGSDGDGYDKQSFTIDVSGYSGNINYVRLYWRHTEEDYLNNSRNKAFIVTDADGAQNIHNTSATTRNSQTYVTSYTEYATNPDTSNPWTWAELADSEIGIGMDANTPTGGECFYTALWIEVNYDAPVQCQMSQIYAIVNYSPAVSEVTLPLPESIGMSHSRNVNRFTFPDGDYAVEDMSRAGKSLSLTGWSVNDMTTKMQDIADMCHYGSTVSITGLPDSNLNTDYYIRGFSFNQEGGQPNIYSWGLDLEEA